MELTLTFFLKIVCIGGVIGATISILMAYVGARFGWDKTDRLKVTNFINSLCAIMLVGYYNNTNLSFIMVGTIICLLALFHFMPWRAIKEKLYRSAK